MKKLTIISALLVAMMAVSCHKDNTTTGSSDSQQESDVAYMSLTVNTSSTRAATSEDADGTTDEGEGDENKIFSLALIAFDYNYEFIDAYQVYYDNDNENFLCKVAPSARRFFAVVNPNEEIWDAIDAVVSFTQDEFSKLPAIEMLASAVSTANMQSSDGGTRGFTMVNSGTKNTDGILFESLVTVDEELSEDIESPTPLDISVDRLVSKFEYTINSNFEENTKSKFDTKTDVALGEVIGVALTATNRATNLYSMIYTNELTNNNVYRIDHNMSVGKIYTEASDIISELEANFYWLKNMNVETDGAFIAPTAGTPEYVLENTCEPSYSNSNNLTQAIVKAYYSPIMTNGSVLSIGTSWFKMITSDGNGDRYLTFDEVKAMYSDGYSGFSASPETKASMDVQLNKIMSSTGKTWADIDVTADALDKCTYGGYKAATVASEDDYVLQYYQKGINYYDVFIQHDDNQEIGTEGRWGMVRNNSYTMDITGIAQEGLPYIPDPTDDVIVDPQNQDPTDPEPADEIKTYIGVTIDVKDWTLWYQASPLL